MTQPSTKIPMLTQQIEYHSDQLASYVIAQARAMTNGDNEFTDIIIGAVVRKLMLAQVEGEKRGGKGSG